MNSVTQSIDISKNKYYQETNTYPETTTYKINGIIVNKQIFYIIRQLCSQHNDLQEKIKEKDKEIDRLNNIINETRRILGEYRHYSLPDEQQNAKNEAIVDEAYNQLHSNLKELKEGIK